VGVPEKESGEFEEKISLHEKRVATRGEKGVEIKKDLGDQRLGWGYWGSVGGGLDERKK